ncbi:MAG: hypothetical protein ACKPFF_14345 [Planktothrix sp.]|jgi:hypothetical protein
MARKVLGIHLVCRNGLNIEELGDGRFKSGYWKVSEQAADTALYLALHDQKNSLSYKQGIIESWEHYDGDGDRIIFYVKEFDRPLEWVGDGTGEKGYCWSEK